MTYDELNDDQKVELKQRILTERNEQRGEGTSYGELADANDLVSDEDARDWAEGMEFSEDDFACSCHGRTVKVERIPQWAACYLVNADDSALTPEDKKMVDDYVERLLKRERLRLICPDAHDAKEAEIVAENWCRETDKKMPDGMFWDTQATYKHLTFEAEKESET